MGAAETQAAAAACVAAAAAACTCLGASASASATASASARQRSPGDDRPAAAAERPGVAYSPNPKKLKLFAELCETLARRGIHMYALGGADDSGKPVPALVLHKLTDDLTLAASSTEAAARVRAVQALADAHPSIAVLDPLPAVECLRDRRAMASAVRALPAVCPPGELAAASAVTVRMPCTVEVLSAGHPPPPDAETSLLHNRALIVKSAAACATPEAHFMALIHSWDQLASLPEVAAESGAICPAFPAIVQPYIPHGDTVYKIYVVGSAPGSGRQPRHYVVPKPSLRLPAAPAVASTEPPPPLLFDALHPSRTAAGMALFPPLPTKANASADGAEAAADADTYPPPDWLIAGLNRELQKSLGLTLFGYDLVREEGTSEDKWWILDVNYFPSYTGCEGMMMVALADTVEEMIAQQEKQSSSGR